MSQDLTLPLTFLAATISRAVSPAATTMTSWPPASTLLAEGKSGRHPEHIGSLLQLSRHFVL